jgi:hypothetical protein
MMEIQNSASMRFGILILHTPKKKVRSATDEEMHESEFALDVNVERG